MVDLLRAGIVDPAKVVRTALQNAASVAGLLVTTEAMVAETPKRDAAPAMLGGGMGGSMVDIRKRRHRERREPYVTLTPEALLFRCAR